LTQGSQVSTTDQRFAYIQDKTEFKLKSQLSEWYIAVLANRNTRTLVVILIRIVSSTSTSVTVNICCDGAHSISCVANQPGKPHC